MSTSDKILKNPTILKIVDTLKKCLSSKYLHFVSTAVLLLCYYLSLDIVAIYYVAVLGILILLLLDDITPMIGLMPYLNVVVSLKNTPHPDMGGSNYYFQPAILAQIIILVALLVGAMIYRMVTLKTKHKFKLTPTFFGLCALSVTFVLNGIFSSGYSFINLAYGVSLALLYLGVFVLFKDNIKTDKENFEKVALAFLAFSILLLVELGVAYLTLDGVIVDGNVRRAALIFGWGVYNTLGMLLVLCIPSVIYLAAIYKHGYLLTVYALVLTAACGVSMSRQALVGAAIILPLSLIYLIWKGKNRKINIIILAVVGVLGIIGLAVFWNKLYSVFSRVLNIVNDDGIADNGRFSRYTAGWEDFKSAPIFGVGFFGASFKDPMQVGSANVALLPRYYHNTFLQMAASCGLLGLAAYIWHRVQTVISYFKKPTVERSYVGVSILVLLVLSLVDVHMFSIFPNLVYSCLLAMLVASGKENKKLPLYIKSAAKK